MRHPLDGITVVALEQAVAAPFATRQLADLGARVIKVERPGDGDFARGYDRTVQGQSSYFVWLNLTWCQAGQGGRARATSSRGAVTTQPQEVGCGAGCHLVSDWADGRDNTDMAFAAMTSPPG